MTINLPDEVVPHLLQVLVPVKDQLYDTLEHIMQDPTFDTHDDIETWLECVATTQGQIDAIEHLNRSINAA